ncbi:hypothetical protein AB0M44_30965 [Streptosporangium subroseum]|uniref:hypothetical protein n=1 Tax=Streptosporangium subroseum TaxID=106412 RepID=UPI003422AAC1
MDRKTGQRISTAWAAAMAGGRRGALTALRDRHKAWDARTTAALVGLVAWLYGPVRRHLAKRRAARTPEAATPTAVESPTEPVPAVAPALSFIAPVTPIRRRRVAMSGSGLPLIAASQEMVAIVSRHMPADMWFVEQELNQLHQVPENVAMGLRIYTQNLETGYPIDDRITSMMGEFFVGIAKHSAMAQDLAAAFSKIHQKDIERRTRPRINEALWNV